MAHKGHVDCRLKIRSRTHREVTAKSPVTMECSGCMASHRARDFFDSNWKGCIGDKERTPEILQKVVDLCGYCIGVQCFTVERLRKNGGH